MKKPTEKQESILVKKIKYYKEHGYYGGYFTYREIVLLVEYYKVITDDYGRSQVRWYYDMMGRGESGSNWFYFNLHKNNILGQKFLEKRTCFVY